MVAMADKFVCVTEVMTGCLQHLLCLSKATCDTWLRANEMAGKAFHSHLLYFLDRSSIIISIFFRTYAGLMLLKLYRYGQHDRVCFSNKCWTQCLQVFCNIFYRNIITCRKQKCINMFAFYFLYYRFLCVASHISRTWFKVLCLHVIRPSMSERRLSLLLKY